jgi:uncharacterized protein YidB (DUF937 family)
MRKTSATGMGARSFDYTVERRERSIYFSALRNGDAENFFGRVVTAQPIEEKLEVSHLDGTSARAALLEVALQGVTTLPGPADHSVEVRLNGQALGRISYDGQQHASEKFNVPLSLLRAGDNTVTLVALNGAGDISLVDYLRLTYPHTFEADADSLRCLASLTEGPAQTLGGFGDASVRVIDVTSAAQVEEIAGRVQAVKGGYQITIAVAGPNRELLAFTDAQVKRPVRIELDRPSSLHQAQEGADLLIVSRHEWMPTLAPLVRLRQQQGLAVKLVDIEDIYDEFNFGAKSSEALRDFLSYSQQHWTRPARYVLLAGKGSYDPRNYLGYGETDLVPAHLLDTSFMEAASDDWFVDFNNDGMADLAIGRLPVLTEDEVALLVRKLITYEQASSLDQALLVADASEGYDFEQASTALLPLLGDLRVTQVNRARLGDEQARKIILEELNQGPKLVNYLGHGSADGWHGGTLSGADAAALTNGPHPSVFVLMTCLNGYYDAAGRSLSEALLKAGAGGAVAVWASTGMSLPVEQARVNREFYRQALASTPSKGNVIRLGDVARQAKAATTDLDVRRTWALLGDPTTTLH